MGKKIILASNNQGKLKEIKSKLAPFGIDVTSLKEEGINIEIEETGKTYSENALLKAKAIFSITGMPVIAEDSGLEIDFLDGKPGIYSARFLGENASYEEKMNKIIELLNNVQEEDRTARFRCVICFIDENGNEHFFEDTCEGKIADRPTIGKNGFGYDPIFEYEGRTFAEMPQEEKNKISHRGKAIKKFVEYIERINNEVEKL